jgi:hypothetical protein
VHRVLIGTVPREAEVIAAGLVEWLALDDPEPPADAGDGDPDPASPEADPDGVPRADGAAPPAGGPVAVPAPGAAAAEAAEPISAPEDPDPGSELGLCSTVVRTAPSPDPRAEPPDRRATPGRRPRRLPPLERDLSRRGRRPA